MDKAAPRVLIVDDEELLRKMLLRIAGRMGLDAQEAKWGVEAMRRMETGAFDLLITDLKLPDASGLDVARRFKAKFPRGETIIVTGFPSTETANQAVGLGIFEYIAKPFDLASIEGAIRKCLSLEAPADIERDSAPRKGLLVADNPTVLAFMKALCELRRLEPVTASNAREALRALQDDPGIGLVLSDIGLPDVTGYELCRQIKAAPRSRGLPVILTSATLAGQQGIEEQALAAGAEAFLAKTVNPYELCYRMEELLAGQK
jgi:CheY-like chemotaxis protein